jgi:hypothetical protein
MMSSRMKVTKGVMRKRRIRAVSHIMIREILADN